MSDLGFELHFEQDLIQADVLDWFQAAVGELSPSFAETMRVLEYERDPSAAHIDVSQPGSLRDAVLAKGTRRGETYQQLVAESPPKYPRRFGDVLISGKARSTHLSIKFDEYTPAHPIGDKWLWSNSIGGRIGAERIDRTPRQQWVRQLAAVMGGHPSFLWGAAFDSDEFRSRNSYEGPDGMWALGRDVRRSLPGLYWLNLFGEPYVQLIGGNRFSTLDAAVVQKAARCVILEIYPLPADWTSEEGRDRHARTLRQLGPQFFYDRANPDLETIAPDFGLSPLPPRRPFQVVTGDGEHFTPLPRDDINE